MIVEYFLQYFNCDTVNYLCWERITNIHDSTTVNVVRLVRSTTLTNDLEAIVTSGACVIGSYIVVYSYIVRATSIRTLVAYLWIN